MELTQFNGLHVYQSILTSIQGLKIIERLVSESDIFIENYIPGKLGSYGLGYEDLKSINPNLIYASLTGTVNSETSLLSLSM